MSRLVDDKQVEIEARRRRAIKEMAQRKKYSILEVIPVEIFKKLLNKPRVTMAFHQQDASYFLIGEMTTKDVMGDPVLYRAEIPFSSGTVTPELEFAFQSILTTLLLEHAELKFTEEQVTTTKIIEVKVIKLSSLNQFGIDTKKKAPATPMNLFSGSASFSRKSFEEAQKTLFSTSRTFGFGLSTASGIDNRFMGKNITA